PPLSGGTPTTLSRGSPPLVHEMSERAGDTARGRGGSGAGGASGCGTACSSALASDSSVGLSKKVSIGSVAESASATSSATSARPTESPPTSKKSVSAVKPSWPRTSRQAARTTSSALRGGDVTSAATAPTIPSRPRRSPTPAGSRQRGTSGGSVGPSVAAKRPGVVESILRVQELADYIVPFAIRAVCDLGVADHLVDGP